MTDSQRKSAKSRGRKICKNCGCVNGVRAYACKQCDVDFVMKKPQKGVRKKLVQDFRTLQKGDTIKVVGGSGSFYTEKLTGERVYLVDRGLYKVINTDDKGIQVYGCNGYGYLYMGKTCPSKLVDSITMCACKILKIYGDPRRTKSKRGSLSPN